MVSHKNLINLDECVINALNLFIEKKPPKIKINFKKPLILGSGNSAVTGKIIFNDKEAVFADESNYMHKIKTNKRIDVAVLISASGGKHAPIIARELKKRKIKTILLTNNKNAEASKFVNKTYIFPKNIEPYTYNTSTYMGMILSKTRENPKNILNYLKKIRVPNNLRKYDAFYFIVPKEFELIKEMFTTKFDELFGPKVSARAFTVEQTHHAKIIVESSRELFISLGYNNKDLGTKRLNMPLPKNAGFATMMAVGYYIIGKIQKQHPPYFKKSIEAYTKKASKIFKQKIKIME